MKQAIKNVGYSLGYCELGYVLLALDEQGLCAVFLGDEPQQVKAELETAFPLAIISQQQELQQEAMDALLQFIDDPQSPLALPLSLAGTDFQQAVWAQLQDIPLGQTTDYASIAARLDKPKAYRAVASACAANKLAIIVPCHRVIRKNGQVSNYRWGSWRKQRLLERERKLLAK